MHFAYPPRKNSTPLPYSPRSTNYNNNNNSSSSNSNSNRSTFSLPSIPRRNRAKVLVACGLALLGLIWLLSTYGSGGGGGGGGSSSSSGRSRIGGVGGVGLGTFSSSGLTGKAAAGAVAAAAAAAAHIPSGKPPVVIVTVIDTGKFGLAYMEMIKENRRLYAEKHGYQTFFPQVGDYDLAGSPMSWTKVIAMRHAMTRFPDALYFWFLDSDALIMNPKLKIETDLMGSGVLEPRMILDHPVVPPDSIIHTFSNLKAGDVDLLLSQDKDGLGTSSYVLRNSEWVRYLVEMWFDPIYRSYNFQKAEIHALEHIVQWHPTILAKLALVPQRMLNAYSSGGGAKDGNYKSGDFVIRMPKCAKSAPPTCEKESQEYVEQWRLAFAS